MLTTAENFGKTSKDWEGFISQYQDGIKSTLENSISAAQSPARLRARYHPTATWEIVLSPDPALKQEPGRMPEELVILDVYFNTGFSAGQVYRQLIIRRYGASGKNSPSAEVHRQKYIVLNNDKNPVDALQKAMTDLSLD